MDSAVNGPSISDVVDNYPGGQVVVIGDRSCTLPAIIPTQHRDWCGLLRSANNVEFVRTKIDDHATALGFDDSTPIQKLIEDVDVLDKESLVFDQARRQTVRIAREPMRAAQRDDPYDRILGKWYDDLWHERQARTVGAMFLRYEIEELNIERLRHALAHARYALRQAEHNPSERFLSDARVCIDVVTNLRLHKRLDDPFFESPLRLDVHNMREALHRLAPTCHGSEHQVLEGATGVSQSEETVGDGSGDDGVRSRASKRIKLDRDSGDQASSNTEVSTRE